MMSLQARRELLASVSTRYHRANRPQKGRILDEFVAATGYHRKYALALLHHPPRTPARPRKRTRKRHYGPEVQRALVQLWKTSNGLCSKRLVPFLPELIPVLERHQELALAPQTRAKLLTLSAATCDRLLKEERRHFTPRGLSTTKPGTLLKQQIPVRTYAEWDEARPGFVEVDLVAHCGASTHGQYLHSLVLTDIATGWVECLALVNRGQEAVRTAIDQARKRLPFALLGLDSDNGSEFINNHLLRYCQQEQITFTRCRPYKKNDQCFVEQKNFTVVRQSVGYDRFEGEGAARLLAQLYRCVRLYVNCFQPSVKLLGKERVGSRVKKRYDQAQTPYQRVQASEHIAAPVKDRAKAHYETLNPAALLRQMQAAQDRLWQHARVRSAAEATNHAE